MVVVAAAACSPTPHWYAFAGSQSPSITVAGAGKVHSWPATAADHGGVISIAWGRDGTSLYVTVGETTSVLREYRRDDGELIVQIPLKSDEHAAQAFDRTARSLYLADGGDVVSLHIAPLGIAARIPACANWLTALTFFDHAARLFAVCRDGTVTEIDTKLARVIRSVPISSETRCEPTATMLSANGTVLFVACRRGRVLYLDRVTLRTLYSVDVDAEIGDMVLDATGRFAVIIPGAGLEIVVLDVRRRVVTARIGMTQLPLDAAVAADGTVAILTGDGVTSGMLVVLDPSTGQTRNSTSPPPGSRLVAVWPDDSPVMRWLPHRESAPPLQPPESGGSE